MYRANEVAAWIIKQSVAKGQPITNLKLQKLLYYIQGAFLALRDAPLFDEEILAWKHGPVVREVYDQYKQFGESAILDTVTEIPAFTNIEELMLTEVFARYGKFTAGQLVSKTHNETPWRDVSTNDLITKESIQTYFSTEVYNDENMFANVPVVERLSSNSHDLSEDEYWEQELRGEI
ncbi:hypothetical protein AGMMS49983_09310 [Clostridia bacterium]|nr:hypothetical protein AGMMS49983_09310 [Clostridia bacterium]